MSTDAVSRRWHSLSGNPLGCLYLSEDSGWKQELYEQRTATTMREVLLEPGVTASAHDRSS